MPLTDAQKERYDLAVEKIRVVIERRPKDTSYINEYKKFIRWVEENNLCIGDKYIHRESVDQYFERSVILRTCRKDSVTRIIQSLQWFYQNLETPRGDFVVRNRVVTEAISQQQENRTSRPSSNLGTDPYKGLKDILADTDKKKIVTHIHNSRRDWGSLNTSFSWGNNAGVRGASTRKLVFADLFMSRGFGPVKEGPRARTLLLVLRQGDPHKDRFTTDRLVGSWRHRCYLFCSVFNTSLHVINELRQNHDINFYHPVKTERASWWDTPLVDYEKLYDEAGPMKEVYAATGVEGCKLTHNRTYAVQHAGSEGLAPYQINSLTKHMLEKFHKSYQAEVDKEACKVMAGFAKDEGYFIEREFLDPPFPIRTLIDTLLPSYSRWLLEAASPEGDKTTLCRKFLGEIIPYMVEVVVQDGIYFIKDFPEHVMSNYLKVRNVSSDCLFQAFN
jgi:hypothetical protein